MEELKEQFINGLAELLVSAFDAGWEGALITTQGPLYKPDQTDSKKFKEAAKERVVKALTGILRDNL